MYEAIRVGCNAISQREAVINIFNKDRDMKFGLFFLNFINSQRSSELVLEEMLDTVNYVQRFRHEVRKFLGLPMLSGSKGCINAPSMKSRELRTELARALVDAF